MRRVEQPPSTAETATKPIVQQSPSELFENDDFLTLPSPEVTTSRDQSPGNTSFSELVSLGLFEQQPSSELVLFLYIPSSTYLTCNSTNPTHRTNTYFDKWQYASPMFQRSRYFMSLYLPPHMRPPMCLQYIIMAMGAGITKTHRQLSLPFYQRARKYIESDEAGVGLGRATAAGRY